MALISSGVNPSFKDKAHITCVDTAVCGHVLSKLMGIFFNDYTVTEPALFLCLRNLDKSFFEKLRDTNF